MGADLSRMSRALDKVRQIAHGGVILIPVLSHVRETTLILQAMLGEVSYVPSVVHYLLYMCAIHQVCLLVTLGSSALKLHESSRAAEFCELVALIVLFVLAPPVTAFTVYFCAFHSVRHLVSVNMAYSKEDPDGKNPKESVKLQLRAACVVLLPMLLYCTLLNKYYAVSSAVHTVASGQL